MRLRGYAITTSSYDGVWSSHYTTVTRAVGDGRMFGRLRAVLWVLVHG